MKLRYLDPRVLRDEAREECYKYFDQNIRKLYNLPDGKKAKLTDNKECFGVMKTLDFLQLILGLPKEIQGKLQSLFAKLSADTS